MPDSANKFVTKKGYGASSYVQLRVSSEQPNTHKVTSEHNLEQNMGLLFSKFGVILNSWLGILSFYKTI